MADSEAAVHVDPGRTAGLSPALTPSHSQGSAVDVTPSTDGESRFSVSLSEPSGASNASSAGPSDGRSASRSASVVTATISGVTPLPRASLANIPMTGTGVVGGVRSSPSKPLPGLGDLLSGEYVKQESLCTLLTTSAAVGGGDAGYIVMTNYQLIFASSHTYSKVPCTAIDKIKRKVLEQEDVVVLELDCRDLRLWRFAFHREHRDTANRMFDALMDWDIKNEVFAFSHKSADLSYVDHDPGWDVYKPEAEFERMGLLNHPGWKLSSVNDEFEMTPSYPSKLILPSIVSDRDCAQAASFRSKGRVPTVVWRYKPNNAVLARCSQPRKGLRGQRSLVDERLVAAIRVANSRTSKSSRPSHSGPLPPLYIVDARPMVNAAANNIMGKGTEAVQQYTSVAAVMFMDIDNIHAMRESLYRVREVVHTYPESAQWYSHLEGTGWLRHLSSVLTGAVRMKDLIVKEGASILVHCSDGWDRTTQLISLASLMLDPYYRTIKGFEVLIEKDWIHYGHKFMDRMGLHKDMQSRHREKSPVFLQFLDCVHQMMLQYPCSFEFNDRFLLVLTYHAHSFRFGTFLCNNEKDLVENKISSRTISLWSFLSRRIGEFTNMSYVQNEDPLQIGASVRRLAFWESYFMREMPKEEAGNKIAELEARLFEAERLNRVHYMILHVDKAHKRRAFAMWARVVVQNRACAHGGGVGEISSVGEGANGDKMGNSTHIPAASVPIEDVEDSDDSDFDDVAGDETTDDEVRPLEPQRFGSSSAMQWRIRRGASFDWSGPTARTCWSDPTERSLSANSLTPTSVQTPTGTNKPVWVPDHYSSTCNQCRAHFNFFRRRHHCRSCGRLFCAACSSKTIPLPNIDPERPVRVCQGCYKAVVTASTV